MGRRRSTARRTATWPCGCTPSMCTTPAEGCWAGPSCIFRYGAKMCTVATSCAAMASATCQRRLEHTSWTVQHGCRRCVTRLALRAFCPAPCAMQKGMSPAAVPTPGNAKLLASRCACVARLVLTTLHTGRAGRARHRFFRGRGATAARGGGCALARRQVSPADRVWRRGARAARCAAHAKAGNCTKSLFVGLSQDAAAAARAAGIVMKDFEKNNVQF